MKFTAAALLTLLPLAVVALPTYDHEYKGDEDSAWKGDDHKDWTEDKGEWADEHKDHDDKDENWKGSFPFHFTSTIVAYATPDTIVNNSNVPVPGLPDGWGKFAFGLNSDEDVICYNITAWLKGNYSSPAKTATHIHQAAVGRAGPPRLAFPNPQPNGEESLDEFSWRSSLGCLKGPFTTGILANGTDTGEGFTIAALEADPNAFFADTHTVEYAAGAIRGQLQWY